MRPLLRFLCWVGGHSWTDPLPIDGFIEPRTYHSHCDRCLTKVIGSYRRMVELGAFRS